MEIKLNINQESQLKQIVLAKNNSIDFIILDAIDRYIENFQSEKYINNNEDFFVDEQWLDIPGFENYYQASNYGRIRSLDRILQKNDKRLSPGQGKINKKGRIFKLKYKQNRRYLSIRLSKNGKTKSFFVHRLIASTFLENPKNLAQVNHINGIKTDNTVKNLEWVNNSENISHAIKTGINKSVCGESHGSARYTDKDIINIRDLYLKGNTQAKIGKMLNIPRERIWEIVHRKTWKHI